MGTASSPRVSFVLIGGLLVSTLAAVGGATTCPPGAIVEPDDCDFGNPDPNDQVNGGCNASPPAFTDIACGEIHCGVVYFDGAERDTDWYRIDTCGDLTRTIFVLGGEGEPALVVGRVENEGGDLDCAEVDSFAEYGLFGAGSPIHVVTACLDPGEYWFFVAPDWTSIVDCNGPQADYVLTLECQHCDPCWVFSCWPDFDCSGDIGLGDLLFVLSHWGACACSVPCPPDGSFGFDDLIGLLSTWGPCPS